MMGEQGPRPTASQRAAWLRKLRLENEEQEAALAEDYDELWGQIEPIHRRWIERFLSMLPPEGRVLDAACGMGKYVGMVLDTGRSVLAVDHTAGYLTKLRERYSDVPTEKHDLHDLPYEGAFDGVMCVDAMEFVPPEEWPVVLAGFRRASRPGGWLYLTVELVAEAEVRAANEQARREGLPVVAGEVIWHDPEPYYHHYPSMSRVRSWIEEAGFVIEDDVEGPDEGGYVYHHVLARGGVPDR